MSDRRSSSDGLGDFGIPGLSFPASTAAAAVAASASASSSGKQGNAKRRSKLKMQPKAKCSNSSSKASYPLFRPFPPRQPKGPSGRNADDANNNASKTHDDDVDKDVDEFSSSSSSDDDGLSLAALAKRENQNQQKRAESMPSSVSGIGDGGSASGGGTVRVKRPRVEQGQGQKGALNTSSSSTGSSSSSNSGNPRQRQPPKTEPQRKQHRQLGIGAFLSAAAVAASSSTSPSASSAAFSSSNSSERNTTVGGNSTDSSGVRRNILVTSEENDHPNHLNGRKDGGGDAEKAADAVAEEMSGSRRSSSTVSNISTNDDANAPSSTNAPVCPQELANAQKFGVANCLCPPSYDLTAVTAEAAESSTLESSSFDDVAISEDATEGNSSAGICDREGFTTAASALPEADSSSNVNVLFELFRRSTFPARYAKGGMGGSRRMAVPGTSTSFGRKVRASTEGGPAAPSTRGPFDGLRRYANSSKIWRPCDSVALAGRCVGGTMALEFDHQGVLLATADGRGVICIYDFDEVACADVAVRRDRSRRQQTQSISSVDPMPTAIRPVMAFSTRSTSQISCLKWNPYSEDQVAVSFLTDSRVRIYDLGSESEQNRGPHFASLSAGANSRSLRGEGTTALLFLSPPNRRTSAVITGGSYGTLHLFHVPAAACKSQSGKTSSLIWSINPFSSQYSSSANSEGITEIVLIDSRGTSADKKEGQAKAKGSPGSLLLLGGNKGSLVLVDKDRCTKKAFSTKTTPTVLWSANIAHQIARRRLVSEARLPALSWLGIKKISMWNDKHSPASGKSASRVVPIDEVHMTVMTNCGWLLNVSIRGLMSASSNPSNAVSLDISLSHKTSTTMYLNSDLEDVQIGEASRTFSLPHATTPASALPGLSSLVCIADVRPSVKVMPNKDKRVLSSVEPSVEQINTLSQNDGDAVLIIDVDSIPIGEQQHRKKTSQPHVAARIRLGDGTPQCIAFHPSSEWGLVGFGNERPELTLLCQRRESERDA